jgi:hypothetical protein
MMRRLVLATVLLLVAACGRQTTAERASSRTATTEPTPSTRNIITEGIHDKRVGQPGGFGGGEGLVAVCDVLFTDSVVVFAPTAASLLWLEYEKTAYRWPVRPPV